MLEALGAEVHRRRVEQLGMTKVAFGRAIGVSPEGVYKIEKTGSTRLSTLQRIAKLCGCTVAELLESIEQS